MPDCDAQVIEALRAGLDATRLFAAVNLDPDEPGPWPSASIEPVSWAEDAGTRTVRLAVTIRAAARSVAEALEQLDQLRGAVRQVIAGNTFSGGTCAGLSRVVQGGDTSLARTGKAHAEHHRRGPARSEVVIVEFGYTP